LKNHFEQRVQAGDCLWIATPGGGGWGVEEGDETLNNED
jgi:5-oxoprolinase (ATP-hydrolysing)